LTPGLNLGFVSAGQGIRLARFFAQAEQSKKTQIEQRIY